MLKWSVNFTSTLIKVSRKNDITEVLWCHFFCCRFHEKKTLLVESAVIFWAFFTCPKNDLQKSRCFSGGYLFFTREKQVKKDTLLQKNCCISAGNKWQLKCSSVLTCYSFSKSNRLEYSWIFHELTWKFNSWNIQGIFCSATRSTAEVQKKVSSFYIHYFKYSTF